MIKTIRSYLQEQIFEIAKRLYPGVSLQEIEVVKSKDSKFADYQCNSAMKLSRRYFLVPQEFSQKIVSELQVLDENGVPVFEKVEVQGPGFLNMTLSPSWIASQIKPLIQTEVYDSLRSGHQKKRVIIDFSSPNIAKEMHVGHLRSTIIGDCLARIFEALGDEVLRLNHVGDWGTAFGMLIEKIRLSKGVEIAEIKKIPLSELMALYKEAKLQFDTDPEFKLRSQKAVVLLQSGDLESLAIWKSICDTSREAFEEIYRLLDVTLIERGESFYNSMIPSVIEEYRQKGLVTESEGAQCIFLDGFVNREKEPLPLMIQKSDGGFNYDTTDLAAMSHRIRVEKADRIIIVTDSGQATHFDMIFKAAEKAQVLDRLKTRVDHVPFGLVLGLDGKKFKTRSGDTEKLLDLIQNAIFAAKKIVEERNPEWSQEETELLAHILGIGAIKYADLASHRTSDYMFSYEKMLRFEGNTAAFIMYSAVRAESIIKKIFTQKSSNLESISLHNLLHPMESQLAKVLLQFYEAIEEVQETLLPNRLTEYLYYLAETFNAFFRDCRVEGDPRESERLALVFLTRKVLKSGLQLLGIQTPIKM